MIARRFAQTFSPANVRAVPMPPQSLLAGKARESDFHDSYATADPHSDWPLPRVWHRVLSQTPGWVHQLMSLRNAIVSRFGLKTGGGLQMPPLTPNSDPSQQWKVGDQTGIFVLRVLSANELIAGQDDKHLDFELSLLREWRDGKPSLILSTVVKEHNLLGRSYMTVITPFHRVICKTLLAKIHDVEE